MFHDLHEASLLQIESSGAESIRDPSIGRLATARISQLKNLDILLMEEIYKTLSIVGYTRRTAHRCP